MPPKRRKKEENRPPKKTVISSALLIESGNLFQRVGTALRNVLLLSSYMFLVLLYIFLAVATIKESKK